MSRPDFRHNPSHILGLVTTSLLMTALVACNPQPKASFTEAAAVGHLPVHRPAIQQVMIEEGAASVIGVPQVNLPAFETAAERLDPAKNDSADDYRASNKGWFAQTQGLKAGEFRPFGEWEEMQSVWTTYSNGMPSSKAVRRMFAEQTINFVRHSKPRLTAHVIVNNATVGADFMKALDEYGIKADEKEYVIIVTMPNQTIWHIDYGPFPMIEKKTGNVAFTDFIYYHPRQIDDAIPTRIGRDYYKDVTVYRMPFPFEGGNIQADGKGTCLTSFRALKNTGFSELKVRNMLKNYMACDKTLIVQDITDDGTGHIDMFFKWIDTDVVMFGKYENEITLDYDGDGKEETLPLPGSVAADYKATFALNQKYMDDNAAMFAAETASNGKKYTVHRLSMMTRFKDDYGNLPRTFINSTFTNGVNVYPSYAPQTCQDPAGAVCMKDADCGDKMHCGAGRCTAGPVLVGCDEILTCSSGTKCVDDPLKKAIIANVQGQWEKAMPTWKHVGLRADTIALWSGAIHCITRTIPKGNFVKTVADGICQSGTCGCSDNGMASTCAADADCFGPAWVCDCQICKGTCKGSKKGCTDDADCSSASDVTKIEVGSCEIDPKQTCPGQTATGASATCGTLSYEGYCDGKTLKFCSTSGGGAKQLSCPSCCGWSKDSGSFDCLNSGQCGKCVPECSKVGETGCGIQGLHSWVCVDEGDCLKRKWSFCGANGTCADGVCSAVAPKVCPTEEQDAGSTAPDAGSPTADAGPMVTTDTGTTAIDSGSTTTGSDVKTGGGGDSGGCTAARTTTGTGRSAGWLVVLLAAMALVAYRRRENV